MPAKPPTKISSQVIDGFVKSPQKIAKAARKPAEQLHRSADRAHTLMRGAVKKPAPVYKTPTTATAPSFNPGREARAKTTPKHAQVNRFGSPAPATDKPRPVVHAQVRPRPAPTTAPSAAMALPSMVTSSSHQRLERILDEALLRADAHKQALKYQAARHFWQRPSFLGRWTGLKLLLVAVILLAAGAVAAWQKIPQFSVRLAAVKAHVSASVPTYKPTGYTLAAPAAAKAGAVVMNYVAPASGKTFAIAQSPSSMTSASLAQTVVPQGTQVQTSQVEGNTIYMYGANNDAAWVNNGILYTIKDHAHLSADEILKIAQGLNP